MYLYHHYLPWRISIITIFITFCSFLLITIIIHSPFTMMIMIIYFPSYCIQTDEKHNDINYTYLRESLNHLTQGFTTVAKDRIGTKKLALFAVTNVLFKIYFKVNTLQLCGKLINVVEGPNPGGSSINSNNSIMNDLHQYPVCDVVMYKYYLGRLKMFEDRYLEARYMRYRCEEVV